MPRRAAKVACTRCGRWVEDDVRRRPPFCRDCRYSDPWFYTKMRGHDEQQQGREP